MARAADEVDPYRIRLGMVFQQSADVGFPQGALLGRKGGQVNQVPDVFGASFSSELALAAPASPTKKFLFESGPFPAEKLSPLRRRPLFEISAPIKEVSQKTRKPSRRET